MKDFVFFEVMTLPGLQDCNEYGWGNKFLYYSTNNHFFTLKFNNAGCCYCMNNLVQGNKTLIQAIYTE